MTIRELVAKFGLDIKGADFKKADRMIEGLKKSALVLGSLWAGSRIVQGARRIAQETAELADGISNLSARSGMSAAAIQELRYAGEAAGVAVGQVDGAIFRLSRRMGAAINGNKAMASAFARAGVAIRDASGKARAAEDVMMDLADRMAAMSSDGERAAVGMELMGDTGIMMAAALKGGAAEVMRLREEARELGLIEAELAEDSAALIRNQQRLRYSVQALKNSLASALIPSMNEMIERWLAWQRVNREWLKQRITEAVTLLSAALRGLASIGRYVVQVIGGVGAAWGRMASILLVAATAAGALVIAFGLKAAAIALALVVLEDFIGFITGKDSVIGRIVDSIADALDRLVNADVDYKSSPWLAFLRDLSSLATKSAAGLMLLSGALANNDETMDRAMEMIRATQDRDARILYGSAPEFGQGVTEEERARAADLRHQLGLGLTSGFVGPAAPMVGPQIEQSVNVELHFTPAEGASPDAIEGAVRRGVGGAMQDAMRGLSPAYAGGG